MTSSIRDRLIAAGLWDANDPRDPETDEIALLDMLDTETQKMPTYIRLAFAMQLNSLPVSDTPFTIRACHLVLSFFNVS